MIDCTIQILTATRIEQREFGQQLISVLLKYFPTHAPQLCGDVEPLRRKFSPTNVGPALECWGRQFFITRRTAPNVVMQVSFAPPSSRPRHSSVTFIDFQLTGEHELPGLKALVRDLAEIFVADYAMAHILTRTELDDWFESRLHQATSWPAPPVEEIVSDLRAKVSRDGHAAVLWGAECLKLHTVHLRKCLPNLYWLNVFGPPYINIFGRDRVMETPSYSVESLSYGGISLQITKDLPDTLNAWAAFKAMRAKCRVHLDCNVFCEPSAQKNREYRTPHFILTASGKAH
jgi:hypothetical protein